MSHSKYKTKFTLTTIVVFFLLTGCIIIPAFMRPSGSDPEPEDMFEIPEIKIEAEVPKPAGPPDYIIGVHIDRVNKVLSEGGNYTQEDLVNIDIWGVSDQLYGSSEGQQTVTTVYEGGCTLDCAGPVVYEIHGTMDKNCIFTLNITQIGKPIECTSSCVNDPSYTVQWNTAVGEHALRGLTVTIEELTDGISRSDSLGNMDWTETFLLYSMEGNVKIKGCEKLLK